MNFGKLLTQAIVVFIIIVAFSLAGAITPQFSSLRTIIVSPHRLF
jgi:hypothetical protein